MKKACILSNGCPESLIDSARVRSYLKENGWQIVDDPTTADLTLCYSCAGTHANVKKSLSIVKELQDKAKDGAQVIVWGCLPKIEPEPLKQIYQGPTVGERDHYKLDEIIHAVNPIDGITANQPCSRYQKHSVWGKIYKLYPIGRRNQRRCSITAMGKC